MITDGLPSTKLYGELADRGLVPEGMRGLISS
jgi:hypothetical protein